MMCFVQLCGAYVLHFKWWEILNETVLKQHDVFELGKWKCKKKTETADTVV